MSEQNPQAVVDREHVDLVRLSEWMDEEGFEAGALEDIELLAGGTQNTLLRFRRGRRCFVLRRPPPHLRKNSNETMRREARVIGALAGSEVPHPGLLAACSDPGVLGASFYLMEPVEGYNPAQGLPEPHRSSPEMRRAIGLSLVDAIAALGRVDYLAVGLDGFGKPDGFLERQVARWRSQLEGYAEFERYPGPEIPGLDEVARWLDSNRPNSFSPGILHGDYHLANVMVRYDAPRLAAIVDWELSTIGDPLLDLGWLLATWPEPDAPSAAAIGGGIQPWDGFPSAEELVARYRTGTTRDLSFVPWYEVLACYKLGIILEGTHARACAGKAPRATGDVLHATTVGLFQRALRRIGRS